MSPTTPFGYADPAEDWNAPEIIEWTPAMIEEVSWNVTTRGVPHDDWSDAHVIGGWFMGRELTDAEMDRLTEDQHREIVASFMMMRA